MTYSIYLNAQNGVIFTNCEGLKGVINNKKEIIINPIFDEIEWIYLNKLYKVGKNGKYGLFKQKLITPGLVYSFLKNIHIDGKTFYIVKKDMSFFVVDKELAPISKLKFTNFAFINDKYQFIDIKNKKYEIINGKMELFINKENGREIYGSEFVGYEETTYSDGVRYKIENDLLIKTSVNNSNLYNKLKNNMYKEVKVLYVDDFNDDNEIFYIKNKEGNIGLIGKNGDFILPAKYKKITQSDYNNTLFEVTTQCGAIGLFSLNKKKVYLPDNLIEK